MPLPQQGQQQPQGGSIHEQQSSRSYKTQRLPDRYRPHHGEPQCRRDSVEEALADINELWTRGIPKLTTVSVIVITTAKT
jgi:hypothetical protein